MAATEDHPRSDPTPPGEVRCLRPAQLSERLDEEIRRAERHRTHLSCLLVVIDNLEEMAREHGSELREQTLAYAAGALQRELRRYDRIGMPSDRELLIVLPGADAPRGEMVARRALDRLHTIKVEARGVRRALRVSIGLADWREGASGADLVSRARLAARGSNGEQTPPGQSPRALGREPAAAPAAHAPHSPPPALGRAARS